MQRRISATARSVFDGSFGLSTTSGSGGTMGAMEKHCQFPMELAVAGCQTYVPGVIWRAPRRGIVWRGRDLVVANLLLESAAMQALQLTALRRSVTYARIIDEFSARFVYRGSGIDGVDLPQGAAVELERLRILDLADGLVASETCIESWTVLRAGVAAENLLRLAANRSHEDA